MPVVRCADIDLQQLRQLLSRFSMQLVIVDAGNAIPGSWFGDSEAGLIGNQLQVRLDTPLHSALHEACHYICMDEPRRRQLHTNAGGDHAEENGVCYLQTLLADQIDGFSRQRMHQDMDEWGYTFRLGSSRAWFEEDAEDARDWLVQHKLINEDDIVQWKLRQ